MLHSNHTNNRIIKYKLQLLQISTSQQEMQVVKDCSDFNSSAGDAREYFPQPATHSLWWWQLCCVIWAKHKECYVYTCADVVSCMVSVLKSISCSNRFGAVAYKYINIIVLNLLSRTACIMSERTFWQKRRLADFKFVVNKFEMSSYWYFKAGVNENPTAWIDVAFKMLTIYRALLRRHYSGDIVWIQSYMEMKKALHWHTSSKTHADLLPDSPFPMRDRRTYK